MSEQRKAQDTPQREHPSAGARQPIDKTGEDRDQQIWQGESSAKRHEDREDSDRSAC